MSGVFLLEVARAIAVSIGAIAAVVGIWRYIAEKNATRRLRWQKTTVQAIMQSSEDRISFGDLQTSYRSFAADHMKKKLSVEDITEEALRMILVDLCRDNVIVQMGSDVYSLTRYLGQMQEMQSLQSTFFEAQLKFLSNNDDSIKEMLTHQKRMTDAVAPASPVQRITTMRDVK